MVQAQRLCEQAQHENERRGLQLQQEQSQRIQNEKKKTSLLEQESLQLRHQNQLLMDELSQLKLENTSLRDQLSRAEQRSESAILEFEVVRSQLRRAIHDLGQKDQVIQQLRKGAVGREPRSSPSLDQNFVGIGTSRQNAHAFFKAARHNTK